MGKPKIRFKGYTEDWEQRKLSELLYLSNEKNDGSYTRDDVLAASLGTELQKKHIYFGLRATDESVKNYKVVLPKDVIYTKSPIKGFPNGIIRTNKGETGIVPTLYCVYHSIDTINPSIIQAYFESKERLDAYLVPLVNIGARNNVNITDKEFINGSICIPKNETEQNRIVDLLEKISNLITLHQRKCEETKKLKKYMLQKMFPKNGESVPEIRFAGFTDAWEQRKLSNTLISLQNNTLSRADLSNETGVAKNVHYGDVLIKFGEVLDVSKVQLPMIPDESVLTKYKASFLQNGDVIVADTAEDTTVGKCSEIAGLNNEIVVSGLHTIPYRPVEKFASGYLGYYLNSSAYHNQLIPLMQGIKVTSISKSAMQDTDIAYPKSVEEQGKIGTYFRSLDHLITLHQRKILYGYEKVAFVWEQRKFSDIAARESSVSASASDIPSVEYEDVVAEEGRLNKDIRLKEAVKSGITFDGSQVLYGKLRPYLHNWLNPDFKGIAVGDWWVLKPINMDKNFLYRLIQTQQFDNIANQSSGSKMPRADWNLISNSEFMVPFSKEEQSKIGRCFDSLDQLITLHHHKPCVFAKTEIFVWEQRKLGDLVDRVTRKNQDLVSELPLTISAQYGLIDQNEFFDKRVASKDVSGYYLIGNGEFAYNKSTSTDAPWGAIKRLDRYENGVLSTLYIVFGIKENNPVDSDFLVSYYSTNLWHKGIHEIAAEGARNHGLLNIAPADFFETRLMIPQDIEEQKKIGKYFIELEALITLHHRKPYVLVEIKVFVWEQRKVSEMFMVTRGYVLPATDTSEELSDEMPYPVYSSQTKDNGLMGYYSDYLYEDAITWTTDGANAGTVNFRDGKFYCTNVCGVLLSDKVEASKAVAEVLNNVAKRYVSYVGNPKLMNNVMADIQITIPTSREERARISSYFSTLDHLITLHQHKQNCYEKALIYVKICISLWG